MTVLHGFPPVSDPAVTTLILGSMPGHDSLEASRYYAHPRNAFWPIMAEIYTMSTTLEYHERLAVLLANGVGLWDVIKSCRRSTSLDSAIEEHSIAVNNFAEFISKHPLLLRICFNGAKAEQSYRRYVLPCLKECDLLYLRLPSTSPANARMSYLEKLAAWRAALVEDY
ncbi:MAG: DNA-deoxyinosine glycosylase [Desulfopila sp.]|jgi:hypoxanthine-DNA glycosylase|nr:DNA-deoxyinosine glycosylase [Desulfopila sp.]